MAEHLVKTTSGTVRGYEREGRIDHVGEDDAEALAADGVFSYIISQVLCHSVDRQFIGTLLVAYSLFYPFSEVVILEIAKFVIQIFCDNTSIGIGSQRTEIRHALRLLAQGQTLTIDRNANHRLMFVVLLTGGKQKACNCCDDNCECFHAYCIHPR